MHRLALALAPFLVVSPASAQQGNPEREGQAPAQARAAQQGAAAASEASSASDENVTYEAVMADPDNIELSYRWARTQIRGGDLKGASATLERVVTLKPNKAKARLLFAIVLYRLDDLTSAERELTTITEMSVPSDIKAEAQEYLTAIQRRRRKTHFNAMVSAGTGFDNNRNASPADGKALLGGIPVQLAGANERRDDFSYPLIGTLGVSRDLRGGHRAFGSFSMFQAEQVLTKTLNVKAYSARAGATYASPFADITPTLQLDHIQLAQQTFLRGRGAELHFSRKVSAREERFFRTAYTYQDYSPTAQVGTANERSGNFWEWGLGAGYWVQPTHRLTPSYTYTIKNAASLYNAYTRHALGLDHTWLLGKGMFLMSGVTAGYDRYEAHDGFVSPEIRQDDNYRVRTMFGAPLSLLWAPLKGLLATAGYEYYHSLSNLSNYAYTNNKLTAMLTYAWGN
ncbi:MAG: tetratricopeptide repeat protein [Elusimicrobia bacterium]|nr:tetratricopeptide repeat protein [Elusimicrobiota bacterium]